MQSDDHAPIRGRRIAPGKLALARSLRRNMTPAERLLWEQLRADKFRGIGFRRQHVIAGFVVDFYCHAARLAVEVDGGIHAQQQAEDAAREAALGAFGVRVIRFINDAVLHDMSGVLCSIAAALASP